MLNLIDKYIDNFVTSFNKLIDRLTEQDEYTKQHESAYIIQIAYRKYLIRKYLLQ